MVLFLMISGLLITANGVWVSVNPPASADAGVTISPDSGPVKGGGVLDIIGTDLGYPTDMNGYERVDYIQFGRLAGNSLDAYIDTGVPFYKNTIVTTTFSLTTIIQQQAIWGTTPGSSSPNIPSAYMVVNPSDSDTPANSVGVYPTLVYSVPTSTTPLSSVLYNLVKKDQIVTVLAGNGQISMKGGTGPTFQIGEEGASIRLGSHQQSFFTGRVYSFMIENPAVYESGTNKLLQDRQLLFDGVPAWDPVSQKYGMYNNVDRKFYGNSNWVSASGSFAGTIAGPGGLSKPVTDPQNPPFAVTFTGNNGMGETVTVDCTDATVLTSAHATCTIPQSMFGGDGGGEASVTVKWHDTMGIANTVSGLKYTYRSNPPTVTSLIPSVGPMTGGGRCTVTGTHFVTLLDALGLPNQVITTGGPSGSRPAAWTEHDKTVYGWFNPDTQGLSKYDDVNGTMFGILSGVETRVPPTLLTFGAEEGGDPVQAYGVTVRSGLVLTCGAIPAHAPGTVDVSVTINGVVAGTLVGKYEYTLVGDLQVVKKGWTCPDGVAAEDISPSQCTLIPDGGSVVAGATVTWTYTTTFVSKTGLGNPVTVNGPALTNVHVYDDKVGDICTHPELMVNKPYVCSAAEPVTVPGGTD